jgi:hypothetical protein
MRIFLLCAIALIGLLGGNGMAATVLEDLRNQPKFTPHALYTGPDSREDGRALTALVDGTIDDALSWPLPIDRERLRGRLRKLLEDVDLFATEDRDETDRYVIRIWRAAGFAEESGLFRGPDDDVLWPWERKPKP